MTSPAAVILPTVGVTRLNDALCQTKLEPIPGICSTTLRKNIFQNNVGLFTAVLTRRIRKYAQKGHNKRLLTKIKINLPTLVSYCFTFNLTLY